jgi:NAD(P)-dependent dehydrogenase (short-subunit alcohol dehydrogenase family)
MLDDAFLDLACRRKLLVHAAVRFSAALPSKATLVTQVPMARLGISEEQTNAIVFIASDEASFITGHVLNVDGGMTIN